MNKIKAQVRAGVISVAVNAILFTVKIWAGIVTGSIALIADAWHTMSDSMTSILVIITAKLSTKKPDKEHPFGHGRLEQVSSLFIAFILGLIAYSIFRESITRFKDPADDFFFGMIALVVTAVSILIKEALAQYAFYLARKTNSIILRAEGWHHRSDSLSSVVVLIGIIISKYLLEVWWMDSILGVFCSLAIFYAALQVLKEAITKLLGEAPSKELIDKINNEIKLLHNEDLKTHHFHIHNYNSHIEMTFHILLDKSMSVERSHKIATDIEAMVRDKFQIDATIHIEPM